VSPRKKPGCKYCDNPHCASTRPLLGPPVARLSPEQARKYPLVAARRHFWALRAETDLHTAYSAALKYYASLTVTP
jgi:hypothetical protein